MLWCRLMWHIFPRGDHMEIKTLRLDFLTLIIHINITKAQNISEKEEKKTKRTQVARGPGSALPARPGLRATPGSRATWAARDTWVAGRALPRFCFLSFALSFAFFYLTFCLAAQKIIKLGSLCFSLRSDGCVLDFLSFFFVYFGLYERLEPLNFFKFCWYKSSFRHSIST